MTTPEKRQQRRWLWLSATCVLLVVLPAIFLAALWTYRTPLLNRHVKPYLERTLSTQLDFAVTIARLELESRHLRIGGLRVAQPGVFDLSVRGLSLDFSLEHLRHGRLDGLRLFQPHLSLDATALSRDDEATPRVWEKPFWTIGQLQIVDGRLDLTLGEQHLAARALALDIHGLPAGDFRLALELAAERPLALSAIGRLEWEEFPQALVRELDVDGRALLAAPLFVRPAPEGLTAGGAIALERLDRAQLEPWLALFGATELLAPELDFAARDLSLALEWAKGEIQGRLDAAELSLRLAEHRAQVTALSLKGAGDVRKWRGTGSLRWADELPLSFVLEGDDGRLRAEIEAHVSDAARLPVLFGGAAALPVSGGLHGAARLEWRDGRLDVAGDFRGRAGSSPHPEALLHLAALSGVFNAEGPLDGLTGEARLDLSGRPLARVRGGADQLEAHLERTELAALTPLLATSLWPDLLERRGWVAGRIRVNLGEADLPGVLELSGAGWRALGFEGGETKISSRLRRSGEVLEFSALRLHTALAGQGVSIPRLSAQGAIRWRPGALTLHLAELHAREVNYLAADDMSAFEGGDLRLDGRLEWIEGHPLRLVLKGGAHVREALVHSFYGDLSQLPLTFVLDAAWDAAGAVLGVTQLDLLLADIATLSGRGQWRQDGWQAQGEVRLPDLDAGYNRQLRPLLATLFPAADAFVLDGSLTLRGEGMFDASGWRFSGTLEPENLGLNQVDGSMELARVRGRIPFFLAAPGVSLPVEAQGWLAHEGLRFGPLSAGPRRLALSAANNRLSFADPWELELAGGGIRIDHLRIGWEPQGLYLAGRTRMDDLDLARLTQDLGLTSMQGTLSADLGEFEYLGGLLQSEGEARVEAFGGSILVRNLRARDLFSSYRGFEADIDLHGLDLAQLTQTFEFGEINGVIDGRIHELRLFGTVPSAFVADIQSRARGRRNISVTAVNNLSVISQGGISAALSRGIYRFIDFYRYRKLGVFCVLRNDVFVLRGTARAGSDLHIVDGGLLPPRIDVLAPATSISFREMLRRLGRIDRTGSR